MKKNGFVQKVLSIALIGVFLVTNMGQDMRVLAQAPLVSLSPAHTPVILQGLKINPTNPYQFDFIVNPGNLPNGQVSSGPAGEFFQQESTKIVRYFLASLAVPESNLWVNLSPYEEDRIIPDAFGQTEMGRDLLAQDYLLKQLSSSLLHPESEYGRSFWNDIYGEAFRKYGTTDIPVDTFHKIWITPDQAQVYEDGQVAYVVSSSLKVLLEEDYFATQKTRDKRQQTNSKNASLTRGHVPEGAASPSKLSNNVGLNVKATQGSSVGDNFSTQIMRELIIPAITKEVNEGEHFALLRQIYHSFVLATWYKKKVSSALLNQVYADREIVSGVDHNEPGATQQIWEEYAQTFKDGVYDFIKEEYDPYMEEIIPRKYFSGGFELDSAMISFDVSADQAMRTVQDTEGMMQVLFDMALTNDADQAMASGERGVEEDVVMSEQDPRLTLEQQELINWFEENYDLTALGSDTSFEGDQAMTSKEKGVMAAFVAAMVLPISIVALMNFDKPKEELVVADGEIAVGYKTIDKEPLDNSSNKNIKQYNNQIEHFDELGDLIFEINETEKFNELGIDKNNISVVYLPEDSGWKFSSLMSKWNIDKSETVDGKNVWEVIAQLNGVGTVTTNADDLELFNVETSPLTGMPFYLYNRKGVVITVDQLVFVDAFADSIFGSGGLDNFLGKLEFDYEVRDINNKIDKNLGSFYFEPGKTLYIQVTPKEYEVIKESSTSFSSIDLLIDYLKVDSIEDADQAMKSEDKVKPMYQFEYGELKANRPLDTFEDIVSAIDELVNDEDVIDGIGNGVNQVTIADALTFLFTEIQEKYSLRRSFISDETLIKALMLFPDQENNQFFGTNEFTAINAESLFYERYEENPEQAQEVLWDNLDGMKVGQLTKRRLDFFNERVPLIVQPFKDLDALKELMSLYEKGNIELGFSVIYPPTRPYPLIILTKGFGYDEGGMVRSRMNYVARHIGHTHPAFQSNLKIEEVLTPSTADIDNMESVFQSSGILERDFILALFGSRLSWNTANRDGLTYTPEYSDSQQDEERLGDKLISIGLVGGEFVQEIDWKEVSQLSNQDVGEKQKVHFSEFTWEHSELELISSSERSIEYVAGNDYLDILDQLDGRKDSFLDRKEIARLIKLLNEDDISDADNEEVASYLETVIDFDDQAMSVSTKSTQDGDRSASSTFDWIFKLGNTSKKRGTGLGLAHAFLVIAGVGGRIGVENLSEERGVKFTIRLANADRVQVAENLSFDQLSNEDQQLRLEIMERIMRHERLDTFHAYKFQNEVNAALLIIDQLLSGETTGSIKDALEKAKEMVRRLNNLSKDLKPFVELNQSVTVRNKEQIVQAIREMEEFNDEMELEEFTELVGEYVSEYGYLFPSVESVMMEMDLEEYIEGRENLTLEQLFDHVGDMLSEKLIDIFANVKEMNEIYRALSTQEMLGELKAYIEQNPDLEASDDLDEFIDHLGLQLDITQSLIETVTGFDMDQTFTTQDLVDFYNRQLGGDELKWQNIFPSIALEGEPVVLRGNLRAIAGVMIELTANAIDKQEESREKLDIKLIISEEDGDVVITVEDDGDPITDSDDQVTNSESDVDNAMLGTTMLKRAVSKRLSPWVRRGIFLTTLFSSISATATLHITHVQTGDINQAIVLQWMDIVDNVDKLVYNVFWEQEVVIENNQGELKTLPLNQIIPQISEEEHKALVEKYVQQVAEEGEVNLNVAKTIMNPEELALLLKEGAESFLKGSREGDKELPAVEIETSVEQLSETTDDIEKPSQMSGERIVSDKVSILTGELIEYTQEEYDTVQRVSDQVIDNYYNYWPGSRQTANDVYTSKEWLNMESAEDFYLTGIDAYHQNPGILEKGFSLEMFIRLWMLTMAKEANFEHDGIEMKPIYNKAGKKIGVKPQAHGVGQWDTKENYDRRLPKNKRNDPAWAYAKGWKQVGMNTYIFAHSIVTDNYSLDRLARVKGMFIERYGLENWPEDEDVIMFFGYLVHNRGNSEKKFPDSILMRNIDVEFLNYKNIKKKNVTSSIYFHPIYTESRRAVFAFGYGDVDLYHPDYDETTQKGSKKRLGIKNYIKRADAPIIIKPLKVSERIAKSDQAMVSEEKEYVSNFSDWGVSLDDVFDLKEVRSDGFSIIYEGFYGEEKVPVYVKILNSKSDVALFFQDAIQREAAALQSAYKYASEKSRKHLTDLLGYGISTNKSLRNGGVIDQPYVIQKKVMGKNLKDEIARYKELIRLKVEDPARVESIMAENLLRVAEAIRSLNEDGIFHNDIGVEEIFLQEDGNVIFTDAQLMATPELPLEQGLRWMAKKNPQFLPHVSWFQDSVLRDIVMFISNVAIPFGDILDLPALEMDIPEEWEEYESDVDDFFIWMFDSQLSSSVESSKSDFNLTWDFVITGIEQFGYLGSDLNLQEDEAMISTKDMEKIIGNYSDARKKFMASIDEARFKIHELAKIKQQAKMDVLGNQRTYNRMFFVIRAMAKQILTIESQYLDPIVAEHEGVERYKARDLSAVFFNNAIKEFNLYEMYLDSANKYFEMFDIVAEEAGVDNAQLGGIAMDSSFMNMDISGQGESIQFNFTPEQIEQIKSNITGITPVIINIQPINNLPLLLGLIDEGDSRAVLAQS